MYPWPVGGGGSIELIHPLLDNDLGGSWRAGPVPVLVLHGDRLFAAKKAGVREARLKAEWLLADQLDTGRLDLHERREETLDPGPLASRLSRLCAHEPLQYVSGWTQFMGLRFTIDRRALIPRPETELLVEWVMELAPPARTWSSPPWIDRSGRWSSPGKTHAPCRCRYASSNRISWPR